MHSMRAVIHYDMQQYEPSPGVSPPPALHPALCCPHRIVLQLLDLSVTTCCNNGLHVWRHGHTTAAQEGTQTDDDTNLSVCRIAGVN